MNKIILEILLGLTIPAIVFHTPIYNAFIAEQPVNKQVSFCITGDSNYNGKAYDYSTATVRVVIFKVSNRIQTILWNKVYNSMPLRSFAVSGNTLAETVTVRNIHDRNEQLFVTYIVTYNNNGSVLQWQNGTTLLKGAQQNKLQINI
jgi:hypothetical protein